MRWMAGTIVVWAACSGGGGADPPDTGVADAAIDAAIDGEVGWPGCGAGRSRAAGTPCGPGAACAVLLDEVIDPPAFRNDAPAIAIDAADRPHLLFSIAQGGFHGYYAGRDHGGWSVAPAMPVATAALVLDADDRPYALVNDGALTTQVWRGNGTGWQPLEVLADQGGWHDGLAISEGGCLYAPLVGADHAPRLGRRDPDGNWTVRVVGGPGDSAEAIAMAPDGTPHMLGWQTDGAAGWGSYWSTPGATVLVHPMGSNVLEWLPFDLTATATGPHVLHSGYNGSLAGNHGTTVLYSQRRADGGWDERLVAEGDPDEFGFEGSPADYLTYRGFAAVSAGEEVRLLYARYAVSGGTIAGTLELAWPAGDGIASQVVAEGVAPGGLSAAIDSQGRIHVAVYDGAAAWGDSTVRYLLLGPAR